MSTGMRWEKNMNKSVRVGKVSFYVGFTRYGLGLGFHVDRWSANVDLGPLWFGVEW